MNTHDMTAYQPLVNILIQNGYTYNERHDHYKHENKTKVKFYIGRLYNNYAIFYTPSRQIKSDKFRLYGNDTTSFASRIVGMAKDPLPAQTEKQQRLQTPNTPQIKHAGENCFSMNLKKIEIEEKQGLPEVITIIHDKYGKPQIANVTTPGVEPWVVIHAVTIKDHQSIYAIHPKTKQYYQLRFTSAKGKTGYIVGEKLLDGAEITNADSIIINALIEQFLS